MLRPKKAPKTQSGVILTMKGQSACQLQDQKQVLPVSLPVDDFNLPVHAKTKKNTQQSLKKVKVTWQSEMCCFPLHNFQMSAR